MGRYKIDIPDELWREARTEALNEGKTVSDWVARAISFMLEVPRMRSRDAKANEQAARKADPTPDKPARQSVS